MSLWIHWMYLSVGICPCHCHSPRPHAKGTPRGCFEKIMWHNPLPPFFFYILTVRIGFKPAAKYKFNENRNLSVTHLTHWGRVTHVCVGNLTIIGSDNGLSPGRRQAIIWNNDGILSIGPNFSEILVEILTFSFKKMRLKVSSAKWWQFCLGLNVLKVHQHADFEYRTIHGKC